MSFTKKLPDSAEPLISSPSVPVLNTPSAGAASAPAPASGGSSKLEAFLGRNSKIVGKLTFTGAVELDGYVEGEIETNERLIIGESANVHAKISGSEVIVKGTVSGDVFASKRLSLHRTARVYGNVSCATISMEEGALFEGTCSMPTSTQSSNVDLKVVSQRNNPEKAAVSIK